MFKKGFHDRGLFLYKPCTIWHLGTLAFAYSNAKVMEEGLFSDTLLQGTCGWTFGTWFWMCTVLDFVAKRELSTCSDDCFRAWLEVLLRTAQNTSVLGAPADGWLFALQSFLAHPEFSMLDKDHIVVSCPGALARRGSFKWLQVPNLISTVWPLAPGDFFSLPTSHHQISSAEVVRDLVQSEPPAKMVDNDITVVKWWMRSNGFQRRVVDNSITMFRNGLQRLFLFRFGTSIFVIPREYSQGSMAVGNG